MDAKTLKALLDKSVLSSADKSKISKAYLLQFGHRLPVKTGCLDCYRDGLAQMYASISSGKRLKAGEVVEYNGRWYNRHDYPLPEFILKNYPDKIEKI